MNTTKNISAADFQIRKLNIIEWLAKEKDVSIIKEIEELQRKRRIAKYEKSLKPMTVAQLIEDIEQSEKDAEAGRVVSTEELKKIVATW